MSTPGELQCTKPTAQEECLEFFDQKYPKGNKEALKKILSTYSDEATILSIFANLTILKNYKEYYGKHDILLILPSPLTVWLLGCVTDNCHITVFSRQSSDISTISYGQHKFGLKSTFNVLFGNKSWKPEVYGYQLTICPINGEYEKILEVFTKFAAPNGYVLLLGYNLGDICACPTCPCQSPRGFCFSNYRIESKDELVNENLKLMFNVIGGKKYVGSHWIWTGTEENINNEKLTVVENEEIKYLEDALAQNVKGSPSQENKHNHDLLVQVLHRNARCCQCTRVLRQPVSCGNGHNFCNTCINAEEYCDKCHYRAQQRIINRNFILEQMIQTIDIPCKFCNAFFHYNLIEMHELNCNFSNKWLMCNECRPMQTIICKDYRSHVEKHFENNLTLNEEFEETFQNALKKNKIHTKKDEYIFEWMFQKNTEHFEIFVTLLAEKKLTKNYEVVLNVNAEPQNEMFVFHEFPSSIYQCKTHPIMKIPLNLEGSKLSFNGRINKLNK